MHGSSLTHRLVRRLAGTAAATGLALAGLVAVAVAWRTRSVTATIASGMAALWTLKAIL